MPIIYQHQGIALSNFVCKGYAQKYFDGGLSPVGWILMKLGKSIESWSSGIYQNFKEIGQVGMI